MKLLVLSATLLMYWLLPRFWVPEATVATGFNAGQVQTEPDSVLLDPEVRPEFPGGESELINYFVDHIKYPKAARAKKQQGTVWVQFVVNTQGEVTRVKVIMKATPLLDQEALRLVNSLPKFKPGTDKGKAVNTQMSMPIRFAL